ncbi:MAG: YraN family protein [Propionibacteriaceae bacterium]|nr:YraN family protein [Propionibacteriaceae bacterium]
MGRADVWHTGEDLAAAHLEGLGWRVLERNWRCADGEVDIIAVQPGSPPVVVFCEVKARRSTAFGQPVEAITAVKLAKLRQLVQVWLQQVGRPVPCVRLDAIGVLLHPSGPRINHLRGIG